VVRGAAAGPPRLIQTTSRAVVDAAGSPELTRPEYPAQLPLTSRSEHRSGGSSAKTSAFGWLAG